MGFAIQLKVLVVLIVVLIVVLGFTEVSRGQSEVAVNVKGRAVFSFTKDAFMVQSDRYLYKVSKKELTPDIYKSLESAADQNQEVDVMLPRSAIAFSWPMGPATGGVAQYTRAVNRLVDEAKVGGGMITLRGQAVYSFTEPHFLIQVNESIYQLKKSNLSIAQIEALAKATPGSRVDVEVPESSVTLAWSYKEPANRAIASVPIVEASEVRDGFDIRGKVVSIVGTMLQSFNDPLILVQSKNVIFQIKKNKVSTKTPKALDKPGSNITLSTPLDAVVLIWSTDPTKMDYRTPASVHP